MGDEHFSVGMDLKQLMSGAAERGGTHAVLDQRVRVFRAIETMGKPSIATLLGYCLGGGLELPLACDFRLAADEGARIGLPELDLRTVPAWGGTARLTHCVGRDQALDMILRAKKIDGREAHRIGLVHEVLPLGGLKSAARALTLELAAPRTRCRRWCPSGRLRRGGRIPRRCLGCRTCRNHRLFGHGRSTRRHSSVRRGAAASLHRRGAGVVLAARRRHFR